MSQKFLLVGFKWIENISQFNKDFIESYKEGSDERYFLEVKAQYPRNVQILHTLKNENGES